MLLADEAGSLSLDSLNEYARARGCGASVIMVFPPNVGALSFNRALGYEERDVWLYEWR
jgi:hypothetical protein